MNTLIKSSGIPSLRSLMEDFWNTESLFDRALLKKDLPAVNIKETDSNYEIEMAAPGYKKEDFKVDIHHDILSISAETTDEKSEESDKYTRKEFAYTSFNRSFSLPENVKEDNIHARYENGLLRLTLEKADKKQSMKKSISID
ncbi:MAG: Hsp20/alpha crystallin family protein [Sphingobacteriaceae bacterium]